MNKSSKNSKIDLTVVIVNYNTGKLLKECVESVIKTYPQCEVVVVDNASNDGSTTGIMSSMGTTRIKLIKNKNNPGFSIANNKAIKIAKGEYILLLNPDTKVKKDALKNLLEFAKEHPDAGVVGAKLILGDGSVQKSVFREPSIINAISEFWFGQDTYSSFVPSGSVACEVDGVVGAAFLITPQAREKAGLLEEKYFMYFEDLDYCKRVRNVGLKIYYLPTSVVIHYHGVSGKLLSDNVNQWKRLIPSSKLYHGVLKHYLLNFVIWFGSRVLHRR